MTVLQHWKAYLAFGFALYVIGFYLDERSRVDDIDPYPIYGLLLIPAWPLIGAWIGVCWVLTKLQIGPFKD